MEEILLNHLDNSNIPNLFDEIREGLGTSNMSLEEMIAIMRRIRDTSDYESLPPSQEIDNVH